MGLWRGGKLTERAGDLTIFETPYSLRAERNLGRQPQR
jgi:hypothetical protein